ncbi:hypothetical protein ILUMI_09035 [Ignelater luminosus]|uniref:Uncharacterized protein n=1 Tax=Ignelater luminosus TaxID=2038154 RepID=A0A8K0D4N5_IGNLU|nr:hypothetical protein ILUMI_09035 [Ignelater luminosus]
MDYVNKLHSRKDVISNVLQSEHWKNKVSPRPKSDTIIPLYLYFDEFETGNPLGAHASIHKVGAIYVSIPCLPPIQQGSLINIFLLMLFHSSDLQQFGSSIVFAKLIDELNHLERRGLLIEAGDANINLFFAVALITGDNLGLNSMLGFTESFRAKFFCRFCKCPRSETQIQCTQSLNLLRNIQNCELGVEVKDVRLTGIKSPCVWNNINSFHVTTNLAVDIMHDIFEGKIHNTNVVASRIDICKTLAVKNQLKLCNRFICKIGFKKSIQKGKSTFYDKIDSVVPNFNELVMRCGQSLTEFMDNIVSIKRVSVQSTTYQIQDIICTDFDCEISMPVFGCITKIIISKADQILFLYKKVMVSYFDSHFQAYKLDESENNQENIILQCDLYQYCPVLCSILLDKSTYACLSGLD